MGMIDILAVVRNGGKGGRARKKKNMGPAAGTATAITKRRTQNMKFYVEDGQLKANGNPVTDPAILATRDGTVLAFGSRTALLKLDHGENANPNTELLDIYGELAPYCLETTEQACLACRLMNGAAEGGFRRFLRDLFEAMAFNGDILEIMRHFAEDCPPACLL